jgi:hypothetical protein
MPNQKVAFFLEPLKQFLYLSLHFAFDKAVDASIDVVSRRRDDACKARRDPASAAGSLSILSLEPGNSWRGSVETARTAAPSSGRLPPAQSTRIALCGLRRALFFEPLEFGVQLTKLLIEISDQRLLVGERFHGAAFEDAGGAVHELLLPLGDLGGMDRESRTQFAPGRRLIQGRERHLRFEARAMPLPLRSSTTFQYISRLPCLRHPLDPSVVGAFLMITPVSFLGSSSIFVAGLQEFAYLCDVLQCLEKQLSYSRLLSSG